jgi:hypothetical protein
MLVRLIVSAVTAWASFLALLFAAGAVLPPSMGAVGGALVFAGPLAVFLGMELFLRRRRIF